MENDVKNQVILASVVWKLAKSGCENDEIAAFYQISLEEFTKILADSPRLAKLVDDAKLAGRAEIRAEIHERALRGDTKLLQHRAQHELGQTSNTIGIQPLDKDGNKSNGFIISIEHVKANPRSDT